MKTEEIVNYIRVHQLSADECQSVMDALMHQPEVPEEAKKLRKF